MSSDGDNKTMLRHILLISYLLILFIVAGAGWFVKEYLGDKARQEILDYNEYRLSLHSFHLTAEVEKTVKAVMLLSGSPWIAPALISGKEQDIRNANSTLNRYNLNLNRSVSYLMDSNGKTIASSNRNDSDSFVGKSYQFRPYFTQAIKGALGQYFALGATSLKRGFYASYPVKDGKGNIIGVAVIKQDVDAEEAHLTKYPYCFIVDPNGIIFLSGKNEMKFKSLWPVSRETKLALLESKQFGAKEFEAILPVEVIDGMKITFDGREYIASRKAINPEGWSIVLMTTTEKIYLYESAGLILTILICTLIIVPLVINYKTSRSAEMAKKSEIRFRNILENIEDSYFEVDASGRFTFFNDSTCKILGYSADEMMGKNNREFTDENNAKKIFKVFNEVYRTGIPTKAFDWELIRKDGSRRFVETVVSLITDSKNVKTGFRGIARDVTERKLAEEAVKLERDFSQATINSLPGLFYLFDDQGRFLRWNKNFEKISGYSAQEIAGMSPSDLFDENDKTAVAEAIQNVFLTGEASVEADFLSKDQTRTSCLFTGKLFKFENKPCLIGMGIDIADRKRAEKELDDSFKRLRAALGGTIQALAIAVETRDPYTAGHQKKVADLSRSIAMEMRLDSNKIDGIRMAGVVHDLGKMSIPAEILSKPSRLSEIEYSLIKTHPKAGYDILKDVEFPWPIAKIVLQHHERIDGSGYPAGLKGEEILLEARIIGVADVVEAIASYRPYRQGLGIEKALGEITKNKGILYDKSVVDACLCLFRDKGYKFE